MRRQKYAPTSFLPTFLLTQWLPFVRPTSSHQLGTRIICQYLYNLETKHGKIRQPYEEDVHVVRDLDGML